MDEPRLCHECGSQMVRDVRPVTFAYKGHSLTVNQPGWYCPCGEGLHGPEDCAATDGLFDQFRADVDGLLSRQDVKRIRKKLHLRQKEAGILLGGSASAFQKYESGTVRPSQAMSNLLRLLDRDPGRLEELKSDAYRAS